MKLSSYLEEEKKYPNIPECVKTWALAIEYQNLKEVYYSFLGKRRLGPELCEYFKEQELIAEKFEKQIKRLIGGKILEVNV